MRRGVLPPEESGDVIPQQIRADAGRAALSAAGQGAAGVRAARVHEGSSCGMAFATSAAGKTEWSLQQSVLAEESCTDSGVARTAGSAWHEGRGLAVTMSGECGHAARHRSAAPARPRARRTATP